MTVNPKLLLRNISYWSLFLVFLALIGCRDQSEVQPPESQYLIEATPIVELSQEEVAQRAGEISPLLKAVVKNGVRVLRVTYKTQFVDGSPIEASGAVALPMGDQPFPMLSIQHGTITREADAPSNFAPGTEFMEYGAVFGGMGYIAVFPDYIGYGASKHLPHPYEHRESLGRACLDMLRAVRELVEQDARVKWDKRLYISGFSEGGYATLSLQKMLEEGREFNLKASTCGAGAYNKTAFMHRLVSEPTHGIASYNRLYTWVLLSYNWIYGLNYPLSYFFQEPFAAEISKDLMGAPLTGSFHNLLQTDFATGLLNGQEGELLAAIADNDLLGWKPEVPTQLYHGTADDLVFYLNTETTYQSMVELGATSVELKRLEGKNHSTAVMDYLLGSYAFFSAHP